MKLENTLDKNAKSINVFDKQDYVIQRKKENDGTWNQGANGKARPKGYVFVTFMWVLNAALRVLFGVMSVQQGSLLDNPVSPAVSGFINVMFLVLGTLGFFVLPGWLGRKRWGILGAVVVSLITIGFDIYGVTVQFTAAAGFFVPAMVLALVGIHGRKLWGGN